MSADTDRLIETLSEPLLHPRAAARQAQEPGRPRMLWREDLVTCVLATWLIEGLTMDAWAHTNQTKLETVVTPWHALFYGGFFVTAGWILLAHPAQRQGRPLRARRDPDRVRRGAHRHGALLPVRRRRPDLARAVRDRA